MSRRPPRWVRFTPILTVALAVGFSSLAAAQAQPAAPGASATAPDAPAQPQPPEDAGQPPAGEAAPQPGAGEPEQPAPGTPPEGAAPEGAAPEGAAPEGAAPEGAAPEGAAPEGAAPSALPGGPAPNALPPELPVETHTFLSSFAAGMVGSARGHGLLAPLLLPGWGEVTHPAAGTLSLSTSLDLAINKTALVDATYGEYRLEVRYQLIERFGIELSLGVGGWDGTIQTGTAGTGKLSFLDALLTGSYKLFDADTDWVDLTAEAVIAVPTGSSSDLLGTKHLSAALNLTVAVPLDPLTLLTYVGISGIGAASNLTVPASAALGFGLAMSWAFTEEFAANLGLEATLIERQQPIIVLALGARYVLDLGIPVVPELGLTFGFSDPAADFGVRLGAAVFF